MTRTRLWLAGLAAAAALPGAAAAQEADAEALIQDALSATIPQMAEGATVLDWESHVLKSGDNGWTCFPTPPTMETGPMCLDGPWLAWADGWMHQKPVEVDRVGLGYMLAGDSGASNSDPYAEEETDDWVVSGPHLMIIVPDAASLEGIPTDPANGGPWVMWKDTPYAHIMVPVR
ncbi:MAG: hypothetical protein ACE5HF_11125 [Gemmatimonadota bacterium]